MSAANAATVAPATRCAGSPPGTVTDSDLSRRLPIALIGGPVVLGLTALGGIPFLILVALLVARGQWELMRFFEPNVGHGPLRYASGAVGLALVVDASWWGGAHWVSVLLMGVALLLTLQVFLRVERPSVAIAGGAALSWLYVAIPLSHLLWLRGDAGPLVDAELGVWSVLALWIVVWLFDTAAYLVGTAWGRHRLLPSVSPAKSWEGTIAALAISAMVGAALGGLVGDLGWGVGRGAIIGSLLGTGALIGDLIESRLKRSAGLKDAGTLLLGHGGVLDRFDSTLVCAPLLYYLLHFLSRG